MKRRLLRGTFWIKVAPLVLVYKLGIPELAVGTMMFILVFGYCIWLFVDGRREQYIEPMDELLVRHTENLVWDNTRWVNKRDGRDETPDEGIDRLVDKFGLRHTQ